MAARTVSRTVPPPAAGPRGPPRRPGLAAGRGELAQPGEEPGRLGDQLRSVEGQRRNPVETDPRIEPERVPGVSPGEIGAPMVELFARATKIRQLEDLIAYTVNLP